MTYDDFYAWAVKQKASTLDYDKTYGLQCVDLAKQYIKKVRGIEPQSIGNAIEYYRKSNGTYVQKIVAGGEVLTFKRYAKVKPKKGDIVVFYNERHKDTGHIAIATGKNTSTGFYTLDTNYVHQDDKLDKAELVFHSYTSFCWCICILRMADKYVNGATVKHKSKVYYVKTKGSNLNLRDKSLKNIIATIANGTEITYIDDKVKDYYHIKAKCTDGKIYTGYASTKYIKIR